MITLCVMPNFKGDIFDKGAVLVCCILLDALYIAPLIA